MLTACIVLRWYQQWFHQCFHYNPLSTAAAANDKPSHILEQTSKAQPAHPVTIWTFSSLRNVQILLAVCAIDGEHTPAFKACMHFMNACAEIQSSCLCIVVIYAGSR